jgi:leucyl aminopeptidase
MSNSREPSDLEAPWRGGRGPMPDDLLLEAGTAAPAVPIVFALKDRREADLAAIDPVGRAWLSAVGFDAAPRKHALVPDATGKLAAVALGVGEAAAGDPAARPAVALGQLPSVLPAGRYALDSPPDAADLAAVAWGLGAYRFRRYRKSTDEAVRSLVLPAGVDRRRALAIVEGVWLGRGLIDTPANDMGPAELEGAARALASRHGASVRSIVGDDLLREGFPMIHAVGRASSRPPRLVDITWSPAAGGGTQSLPRVTLVGKGICFDTGGLDIKPSAAMLLMKKDMGGAAAVLALGHMVMALGLPVRLRILLAIAENSIAGNAFRPGDIIPTRAGKSVEIGNTDAEGRLVLADALSLADEEAPDLMATFATLTGAARVAVGPELAPFYTRDDALAADLARAGDAVADPVWRMPLWPGYESSLDSPNADLGNVSDGPFAGSVTAALFLHRFVAKAHAYLHFDIYGWRPTPKPLGPKGGEVNAARALLGVLEARYAGTRTRA